jgi:hypothetical protein
MKWFLFLFLLFFSCRQDKSPAMDPVNFDSSILPKRQESLTATVNTADNEEKMTPLIKFFQKNADQSALKFHKINVYTTGDTDVSEISNYEANQGKTISRDSIHAGKLLIIQVVNPSKAALLSFRIDGKEFKKTIGIEPLRLNENACRYFSFKGKEYYYLQAKLLYSYWGSIGNVYYHMIYVVKNRELSTFMSCRFPQPVCFGDADADDRLDFLHFSNENFCTTVPSGAEFEVNLYSCNEKGKFELRKDKKGTAWYIVGNSGESYGQDSFNITKHYWPIKIR